MKKVLGIVLVLTCLFAMTSPASACNGVVAVQAVVSPVVLPVFTTTATIVQPVQAVTLVQPVVATVQVQRVIQVKQVRRANVTVIEQRRGLLGLQREKIVIRQR